LRETPLLEGAFYAEMQKALLATALLIRESLFLRFAFERNRQAFFELFLT
jgi:hypothetical protein